MQANIKKQKLQPVTSGSNSCSTSNFKKIKLCKKISNDNWQKESGWHIL